jgi:hypothetical protein
MLFAVPVAGLASAQAALREWKGIVQPNGDCFGSSLAGLEDVDRDGVPDALVDSIDGARAVVPRHAGMLAAQLGRAGRVRDDAGSVQ